MSIFFSGGISFYSLIRVERKTDFMVYDIGMVWFVDHIGKDNKTIGHSGGGEGESRSEAVKSSIRESLEIAFPSRTSTTSLSQIQPCPKIQVYEIKETIAIVNK